MENKEFLCTINKEGKEVPTLCTENIVRIFRKHPSYMNTIRHDEFRQVVEVFVKGKNRWEQMQDSHEVYLMGMISTDFPLFQKVPKYMVSDALLQISYENTYDSAVEYLDSITWDGVERLDTWIHKVYKTQDDEYHRKVASNWMKAIAKRIRYPGTKFDHVLVIYGKQGTGKSSSLASLIGDAWHTETTTGIDTKDFFMSMRGKLVLEFSEGELVSRSETKKMKAIITTQVDSYRLPYAKNTVDVPRRCVFAMTTNEMDFSKDATGNRRWLPIETNNGNSREEISQMIKWIKDNRDQIFAEADYRANVLNESIHEFPINETLEQQRKIQVVHPLQEDFESWYMNMSEGKRKDGITILEGYHKFLDTNNGYGVIDRKDEMIIADIYRTIGLEKKRVRVNGIQKTKWFMREDVTINSTDVVGTLYKKDISNELAEKTIEEIYENVF